MVVAIHILLLCVAAVVVNWFVFLAVSYLLAVVCCLLWFVRGGSLLFVRSGVLYVCCRVLLLLFGLRCSCLSFVVVCCWLCLVCCVLVCALFVCLVDCGCSLFGVQRLMFAV